MVALWQFHVASPKSESTPELLRRRTRIHTKVALSGGGDSGLDSPLHDASASPHQASVFPPIT